MTEREPPEGHEARQAVLASHFTGKISAQAAAEKLASVTLEEDEKLSTSLNLTWCSIMFNVQQSADHLKQLVDILVCMASLSPPTDETLRMVDREQVWADLPGLDMELNWEWNSLEIPDNDPERQQAIARFVNVNRFAALLYKNRDSGFGYVMTFMEWTMGGLESPTQNLQPIDAFLPAAASLVDVLAPELSTRDKAQTWRQRFGELAHGEELPDDLRSIARTAEAKMANPEA